MNGTGDVGREGDEEKDAMDYYLGGRYSEAKAEFEEVL